MRSTSQTPYSKKYNEEFIHFLHYLSTKTMNEWTTPEEKKQNSYKSAAYKKAAQTISNMTEPITHPQQLANTKNIGKSILEKLTEYYHSGSIEILPLPYEIFTNIYGVGSVKAKELVSKGFTTIQQLRENLSTAELNEKQRIGLQYYEPLLEKIPRNEITQYYSVIQSIITNKKLKIQFEIVGSYRRGAQMSGDIDVIITSYNHNDVNDFYYIIDTLTQHQMIIEILAKGPSKCLAISKLSSSHLPRRIDFLFTSVEEYPFAVLYFTGSKEFNTFFRGFANEKGYSLNEHMMILTKTGEKVKQIFRKEEDIFDFIGLSYVEPTQRDHQIEIPKTTQNNIKNIKSVNVNVNVNNIISLLKTKGISSILPLSEDELFTVIQKIDSNYYHSSCIENNLALTDTEYDVFRDYLKKIYPTNPYFQTVGSTTPNYNKVKLPVYMGSMNKIHNISSNNWTSTYKGPFIISCKLDGVSGLYVKNVDGTEKLYTRGDGEYGQDISHFIPYLKLPKNNSKQRIILRGEFIIDKQTFQTKYVEQYSNARNLTSGIINRHFIDKTINDIHFITYEVISPSLKPSEQFQFLYQYNYSVVHHFFLDTISEKSLTENLVQLRDEYNYQIDGLIVTDDNIYERKQQNPAHSFAFKIMSNDQIAEATVVDVLWTPSKDGYLKPRIQIIPISVGNVKITFMNGFNGAYIQTNKIGPGATLRIVRSGDVIPHILDILTPAKEAKMPDPSLHYHWTDSGVDIIVDNIDENDTVRLKQITLFFRKLEVDDFSEKYIQRVINAGFNTIIKIINMKMEDFLSIPGFQEKLATKIHFNIKDKVQNTSILQLMDASNIFPRGFSKCKIQLILETFPNLFTDFNDTENEKTKWTHLLAELKGLSIQSAAAFIEKLPQFILFFNELTMISPMNETYIKKTTTTNHPLYQKIIVMTGFRNVELVKQIEQVGGIISNNVSKNTSILVCKNADNTTTNKKMEDAKKWSNIVVMDSKQFLDIYFQKM